VGVTPSEFVYNPEREAFARYVGAKRENAKIGSFRHSRFHGGEYIAIRPKNAVIASCLLQSFDRPNHGIVLSIRVYYVLWRGAKRMNREIQCVRGVLRENDSFGVRKAQKLAECLSRGVNFFCRGKCFAVGGAAGISYCVL
jgi:hypothetical protein